jgi:hypothetical protein
MSNTHSNQRTWASPANIGLCLFIAIAAFFLWTEHRAHLLGILPYLILLACPFIHLFMHRGHGGHGRGNREGQAGLAHRHGETS